MCCWLLHPVALFLCGKTQVVVTCLHFISAGIVFFLTASSKAIMENGTCTDEIGLKIHERESRYAAGDSKQELNTVHLVPCFPFRRVTLADGSCTLWMARSSIASEF